MIRFRFACLVLVVYGFLPAAPVSAANEAAEKPVRVLLTYGGHRFQQEPFFAMFAAMPNVTFKKAPLPASADLLKPGLENDIDVIVMYDMVGKIEPEQQQSFVALLRRGIGLVSLHHNIGAHREWPEFRRIIGGQFVFRPMAIDGQQHGKSSAAHGQELRITIADREHPITRGLRDFEVHDETYGNYYTSPRVQVLMTTDNEQNDPEIAWVHRYGKSRVFYFMLGHDNRAWQNPAYPEIVRRAIHWTAGR